MVDRQTLLRQKQALISFLNGLNLSFDLELNIGKSLARKISRFRHVTAYSEIRHLNALFPVDATL